MTNGLSAVKRTTLLALGLWLLVVSTLAIFFHSLYVLEIFIFPSFVFAYIIWNEYRLDKVGNTLAPLSPSAKFHFFFTIPGLLVIRMIFAISRALKGPYSPWIFLPISFGAAWAALLLYLGAILVRKRAAQKVASAKGGAAQVSGTQINHDN